jgi:hypothetical protein
MPIDHPSRRKRASLWAWLYVALVAPAAAPDGDGDTDVESRTAGRRDDEGRIDDHRGTHDQR